MVMRKALIPAFLLILGAVVLGSTVFREQVAQAADPFLPHVFVANGSTNPVPVQQVGTSTTSVSGTVGLDPSHNTVKLDSGGNTVNLDSTDATNLANVEGDLNNLKFDNSGNLETSAQTTAPGPALGHCLEGLNATWSLDNDSTWHTLCSEDFYLTNLNLSGMDDSLYVNFYYKGNLVLELNGSGAGGASSYQFDLVHPMHIDGIAGYCFNGSTNCNFSMVAIGNSTGS
jgi:hypothetical protein